MPMLTCPNCQESGKVPDKFIGVRIKCKKCGTSLQVTAQGAEVVAVSTPAKAVAAAAAPSFSGIHVDGLDSSAWTTVSDPAIATIPGPAPESPNHQDHATGTKEYKLLTQKDKWFDGKFDLARLEEALNAYARQGWVVRSMATPLVPGFTGGPKEEIVVLLER